MNGAHASLASLLRPASIAIVGASNDPAKVGGRSLRYLIESGFAGAVYPVNPRGGTVQGRPAFASMAELPASPDVAILSVPAEAAEAQLQACVDAGTRNAILFASGFAETGIDGALRQAELLRICRAGGMRLLGPNTLGAANFATGAVLSFASVFEDVTPRDGPVAIVSQSGAIGVAAYSLLRENGIGVRYVCATGNQADIDVSQCLHEALLDPAVRVVLLYMEEARNLAALRSALSLAAVRGVPVLALRAAGTSAGRRMAACHTGAAGTVEPALAALLEEFGCTGHSSLPALCAGVPLYLAPAAREPGRVALVSNSGASCVMAADACAALGLPLAQFSAATLWALDRALPPFSRSRNPIDLTAMLLAEPSLLGRVMTLVLDDPDTGAAALSLLAVAGASYDVARFAAETAEAVRKAAKPVVFSSPDARVRQHFVDRGVAVHASEEDALRALLAHRRHASAQRAVALRSPIKEETR